MPTVSPAVYAYAVRCAGPYHLEGGHCVPNKGASTGRGPSGVVLQSRFPAGGPSKEHLKTVHPKNLRTSNPISNCQNCSHKPWIEGPLTRLACEFGKVGCEGKSAVTGQKEGGGAVGGGETTTSPAGCENCQGPFSLGKLGCEIGKLSCESTSAAGGIGKWMIPVAIGVVVLVVLIVLTKKIRR